MADQTRSSGTSQVPISEDQAFNEAYASIEAALGSIDPDDTLALYARCERILDDIHYRKEEYFVQ
jgi:hypothetical protein